MKNFDRNKQHTPIFKSDNKKSESFLEDMIDIIEPNIDQEIGNDDAVYGSYIEWGAMNTWSESIIEELLTYFDIDLPFEENILVENLFNSWMEIRVPHMFINSLVDIIMKNNPQIDYKIKFPSLSAIRSEVEAILAELGVPNGTNYEFDGDFPESAKYWQSSHDEDFEYYQQNKIELQKTILQLNKIEQRIEPKQDELIVKSLILSGFVYVESFIKSQIFSAIDLDNSISDKRIKLLSRVL